MTSATNHATLSRTTSACSLPISLSTNPAAVILPFSAIVVLLHPSICERTDDSEAHGGRPTSGPARRARYTTSTDLTSTPWSWATCPIDARPTYGCGFNARKHDVFGQCRDEPPPLSSNLVRRIDPPPRPYVRGAHPRTKKGPRLRAFS